MTKEQAIKKCQELEALSPEDLRRVLARARFNALIRQWLSMADLEDIQQTWQFVSGRFAGASEAIRRVDGP